MSYLTLHNGASIRIPQGGSVEVPGLCVSNPNGTGIKLTKTGEDSVRIYSSPPAFKALSTPDCPTKFFANVPSGSGESFNYQGTPFLSLHNVATLDLPIGASIETPTHTITQTETGPKIETKPTQSETQSETQPERKQ